MTGMIRLPSMRHVAYPAIGAANFYASKGMTIGYACMAKSFIKYVLTMKWLCIIRQTKQGFNLHDVCMCF